MPSSSYELVLTSSPDGPIVAYDASTGAPLAFFLGTRSPRRGLTVAGNSFIVASHVSPDTAAVSIHLYNWHTSSVLHRFSVPEFVAPLVATPDGGYILAGGQSGSIHCFSVPSGDLVKSFLAHTKLVSCLQLSNDGSLVISGSDDGSITVIPTFEMVESSSDSAKESMVVHHLKKAHSDSVTALSTGIGLCSSNSMLVSSSLDSTCKFWNLLEGTLLRTVNFPCAINGVVVIASSSSDSSQDLFAAGLDGSVYKASLIMKAKTRKAQELMVVKKWNHLIHVGPTESVVVVNGGRNLVSAGEDGSVWMWEIEREEVTMVMKDNNSNSNGLVIMEGGTSISDMIVVSGTTERRGRGGKSGGGGFSSGLLKEEVMRSMKNIMEAGDLLSVVEEDKRRAINMLESAIALYERLLELILEEALKGGGGDDGDDDENNEEEEKGDDEEDREEEGK